MSDLPAILPFWRRRRAEPLALATVVRTYGSTYRRSGARMLVSLEGESAGLVSGGCLEKEVIQSARYTLNCGEPRLGSFDTRRLLGCNGALDILIERLLPGQPHLLAAAETALADRRTFVAATIYGSSDDVRWPLGSRPVHDLAEMLPPTLSDDRPRQLSHYFANGRADVLLHPIRPPVRLMIIGAGPDVTPLAVLGQGMGWEITVIIHPSQEPPPLPSPCTLRAVGPDEVAALLTPDPRTAAVVMTHNYGRDLAYLAALLPLRLPYIGLLGPRTRRDQMLADLADCRQPWDEAQLAALFSPVGLDIGAELPEEVALAVLSEVQAVFACRPGGRLRDRTGPIHTAPLAA